MTYDAEPEKWRSLVGDIMRQDWGWNDPAKTYVEHYWKGGQEHEGRLLLQPEQRRRRAVTSGDETRAKRGFLRVIYFRK